MNLLYHITVYCVTYNEMKTYKMLCYQSVNQYFYLCQLFLFVNKETMTSSKHYSLLLSPLFFKSINEIPVSLKFQQEVKEKRKANPSLLHFFMQ